MSDCFGELHVEVKEMERDLRFAKAKLSRLEVEFGRTASLGRDEEHRVEEELVRARLRVQVLEAGILGCNERLLRGWGGE